MATLSVREVASRCLGVSGASGLELAVTVPFRARVGTRETSPAIS